MAVGPSYYGKTNSSMARRIEEVVRAGFPIESADGRIRLEAANIRVEDGAYTHSLKRHQNARETGESIAVPIRADMTLYRDGKKVQTLRNYKIGDLPMMTALGTFMVGGNDYYTPKQLRLKPGVYTREMSNGNYESFINLKGRPLKMWMEPERGVLKLAYGSTNVNLYPVLRVLGATDDEILKAMGGSRELLEKNRTTKAEPDIDKLYAAIFERAQNRDLIRAGVVDLKSNVKNLSLAEKSTALKQWFSKQEVDPFVTRKTLGTPIQSAELPLLLSTVTKLLKVSRQEAEPDDRDALEFKTLHTVDDMLPERVQKRLRFLRQKVLQRLAKPDTTIARGVGNEWLNDATMHYFGGTADLQGGMANTAEAANPLAILSEQSKVTLTGEGGIGDDRAITISARLFRPTAVGFMDPVHSPEGSGIGVTTHLASNAEKGDNNQINSLFYTVENGKIGKLTRLSVEDASDAVVGYPEYWDTRIGGGPKQTKVRANKNGSIVEVDAKEVQYVLPSGRAMLDHTSNAALFFAHTHANRGMMAGKHLTQALPLVHREAPLTDLKGSDGEPIYESLARPFTVRAPEAGRVTAVSSNEIVIEDRSGKKHTVEIFDNYPMQAKVGLHHYALVKVGDTVKKGQLIADSNYSKDGKLALGVNLRSAYLPWKDATNFEDAVVISESAAKKLSSEHIHRYDLATDGEGIIVSKKLTQAQYPTAFTAESFAKLDADGVIENGATVNPGDVLIAAVQKRRFDEKDRSGVNLSNIHKMLDNPYKNISVKWDESYPGVVYRVVRKPNGIDVHIKTVEPMQVGDKMSMSSAAKGTVSRIVPDDKMPRNADGEHMEVIFNPHGVAGRINPSQTIEQAVGKLVRKHGVKYDHSNFDGIDHAAKVKELLAKHGDSHTEKLFDPETGKWLEQPVATGYNYVFKLDHPVRKKFSARERDGYTMDETPTRGKGKSGQSYDQLTTYALLGHNAHALLGESFGIRGVKNDDFWVAYQAGETPPPPKVPFVFEKFRNYLLGAGVDMRENGDIAQFLPLTEKAVLDKSNGKISKPTMLRARGSKSMDLAEEKGGLFDVSTTGGVRGENYAHIELDERLPHPLYEKVVRDLTGLRTSDFYGLLAHTRHLDTKSGKIVDTATAGTVTGEKAFDQLLRFDIDERLNSIKNALRTAVGSDRNKLHRASRYLRGLKETGLSAAEAYMTKAVPVIPPKFRPVVEAKGGTLRVADSNLLYRDVLLANEQLMKGKESGMPSSELRDARLAVYKSFGALVGVNNPLTHRDDREDAHGFVDIIKGKQNKQGLFQSMLARRRNDYTGRSTIEPDADLGPDEIAIPDDMAWKIYKPMTIRRMSRNGWSPAEAMKQVEQRTEAARQALDAEMADRPVLYNRAPSLHRWSVSSAFARRHPGKDVKISPAVLGPYNADFDGDTMSVVVPITDEAAREAVELLPSRNVRYDRDRALAYKLEKDVVTGLFALTKQGVDSGLKFPSIDAALDHFKNNKQPALRSTSLVQIEGEPGRHAIGWLMMRKIVPPRFLQGIAPPIDGKKLETMLERIADQSPGEFNLITRRIAQAGFQAGATVGGITTSVDELAMNRNKVKNLLDQMDKMIQGGKTEDEKRRLALEANKKFVPDINKEVSSHLAKVDHGYNAFLQARMSGKINPDQFRQMLASPVLVSDINDRVVPAVIKSSYGEGMRPSDYILTTPGARKGLVARSLSTALPGFLAKEIAGNMSPIRIKTKDCDTTRGIEIPLNEPIRNNDADILDRHLLRDVPGIGRRNDPVTPDMLARMRDKKMQSVWVRSAMTCEADSPPCQLCAGRDASGNLHPIGANIGLNYGQAVSEPSTQLTMRAFHSGGTLGSGDSLTKGFARLRELLSAPEIVRGQGTLAENDGRVDRIRPAPQGGTYVYIDGKEHYVQQGRNVTVKMGDEVKRGDAISDGSYRPQELAVKRSVVAAQQYVVDQARSAFQDAGATVRKPVLEVVVAGMMRYVELTDDGGETDLAPGDVLHENEARKRQQRNPRIKFKPYVPGLSSKPIDTSKDLMERLNFQRLEDAVREIPAVGGTSDLTGDTGSPLSGFAYGVKFRPGQSAHIIKKAELTLVPAEIDDDAF